MKILVISGILVASAALFPVRSNPGPGDENWVSLGGFRGADEPVLAIATDRSGNVYVGGHFAIFGTAEANRIAKWDGNSWSPLGAGMNASVYALAVDGLGNLYAGGEFTQADGVSATRIAKWDGSNWSALGEGLNGRVSGLAVDGAGNVYAGGQFTLTGAVGVNHIAKWDGKSWSALGSGVDATVYALTFDKAGNLYAGGQFTVAGEVSANRVARWDGNSWSALGPGTDSVVYSLAFDNAGVLFVGGLFSKAGGTTTTRIAKWDGSNWSAVGSGLNAAVSALTSDSAGSVYAGGNFSASGIINVSAIAKWDGSKWSALGTGVNNTVNALALDGSGNLYIGGAFLEAGGTSAGRIAKWDGSKWSQNSGMDATVFATTVDRAGNLYAGGQFVAAGNVAASRIAKWNGSDWSPLGSGVNNTVFALANDSTGNRLYAGGSFTMAGGISASRIAQWDGANWSPLGSGVNNLVQALAVDNGGNLYVGGVFTVAGGISANRVAKWDGKAWSALGFEIIGTVRALAVDDSGNLYAGGDFLGAGGVSANRIAKWDGNSWSALSSGTDGAVSALALDSGGNLYAGGVFVSAGGISAMRIAKWDGSNWSALGSGLNNAVNAIALDGVGDLIAGGVFSAAGRVAASRIAQWDGNSWSALGSGVNSTINSLAPGVAGSFYAGGNFTLAGGKVAAFTALHLVDAAGRPVLAGIESEALSYTAGEAAKLITGAVTITDSNSSTLAGANIRITGNYAKAEDLLVYSDSSAIKGRFDPERGELTLSGSDTVANYQAALRSVAYRNAIGNPTTLTRTVAFTVNDGALNSAAATRQITLHGPLIIRGIPKTLTITQNASTGPISFTIDNTEGRLNELSLAVSSSNPILLPLSNVFLGGSGANRFLQLTPAIHRAGRATVTVSASDAIGAAQAAIELVVNAVPVLSELLPVIIPENSSWNLPFSIADEETPPQALSIVAQSSNPALIPNEQIALSGTGARRVLSFAPALNQIGSASISVTVKDAAAAAMTRSFLVTVVAATQRPADQLNVIPGSAVTFHVDGRGLGELRYQWRHNGNNITGANADTVTIPSAQVADGGLYEVVITDSLGTSVVGPTRLALQIPSGAGVLFDRFADAAANPITDLNRLVQFNNSGATREPGEPNHTGKTPKKSVWMQWVSPSTPGVVSFDTDGSAFDTVLAIYTGDAITRLLPVAGNRDHDGLLSSLVRFSTRSDAVYWVAVDASAGSSGDFVLRWSFQAGQPEVPIIISQPRSQIANLASSVSLSVVFTPAGASVQWFKEGRAIQGATGNTYSIPSLDLAAVGTYSARIRTQAGLATDEVFSDPAMVQVYSANSEVFAQDKFSELIEPAPSSPQLQSNRVRPDNAPARGYTGGQIFSTVGAASEPGEPVHCGTVGGASAWYAIQPEADGQLTIVAQTEGFDPILAIYTDPLETGELTGLRPELCNVSQPGSRSASVTLPCSMNRIYYVACDGVAGGTGLARLSFSVETSTAALFSGSIVIQVEPLAKEMLKLSAKAAPQRSYTLQSSSNLVTWADLRVTNSASGLLEFLSGDQEASAHFRLRVNP